MPVTFGNPSDECRLALDSAMGLLEHSISMGQLPAGTAFMGYAALQDISQNGLIRACIETVSDDMTRNFGTLKSQDGALSEEIKTLDALLKRFNVQEVLHDAAVKTGYFGGCLVFIDTGADDATNRVPLSGIELEKLRRFTVIDPINVTGNVQNTTNPLRQDFYKPNSWFVMGMEVHASRLIRIVQNEPPQMLKPVYNFLGIPQAQILWDYVLHFNACRKATADMALKFSQTVLKTNMTATLMKAGGIEELNKRMRLIAKFRDNNSVTAIDRDNEDIVKIETPLGGLTDVGRQALEFIAAINRTPAVKLLGISPSGFNATGESDIRNYYDHIKSQQEKTLRPAIDRIVECLCFKEFGKRLDLTFEFSELGQEDESALIATQKMKADTVAVYVDRSIVSAEEAREYIAGDPDNAFAFIDPEEMPDSLKGISDSMDSEKPPEGESENENENDDVDKAGAVYG